MGTYHKVASPTRHVLLYCGYHLSPSLIILLPPLYADGMIIVYDKDREDCMSIHEAPTKPLTSPPRPQSNDLPPPPPLPMFREGASLAGEGNSLDNHLRCGLTASSRECRVCGPQTGGGQATEKPRRIPGRVETERRYVLMVRVNG